MYSYTGVHISGGGAGNFSTSAIDTSGMDLLVMIASSYQASAAPAAGDSKSNVWNALTKQELSDTRGQLFYCKNPTVGTGHTFSLSGGQFNSLAVIGVSGSNLSAPFDQQSTGSNIGSGVQPGSITPSQDNEIVICAMAGYTSLTPQTIDSGFTITDDVPLNSGVYYGCGLAYKIQTTAAAVNPTWDSGSFNTRCANIASFKVAAAVTSKLFRQANLSNGAGGPFFSDPLGKVIAKCQTLTHRLRRGKILPTPLTA